MKNIAVASHDVVQSRTRRSRDIILSSRRHRMLTETRPELLKWRSGEFEYQLATMRAIRPL